MFLYCDGGGNDGGGNDGGGNDGGGNDGNDGNLFLHLCRIRKRVMCHIIVALLSHYCRICKRVMCHKYERVMCYTSPFSELGDKGCHFCRIFRILTSIYRNNYTNNNENTRLHPMYCVYGLIPI